MPEPPPPVWYRSLYWRVAIGTLAVILVLLAVQAALVIWVVGRSDRSMTRRAPLVVASLVVAELSASLEADAPPDPQSALRDAFGRAPQNIAFVIRDGGVATNRRFELPAALEAAARRSMRERDDDPRAGRARMRRFPQVHVNGELRGVVVVLPAGGPLEVALGTYGPALAGAGFLLLVVGTLGVLFFVLTPTRRRLRSLETAAAALGRGDASARAPEGGVDEIARLATAFNGMADELERRMRDLTRADEVRRQLLADVSHELMTPLTAIRGYLETLAMPALVKDDAARERFLRIVTEETGRLEAIIGDLLDLARLEGGGGEIDVERVPVAWLFERVAERHGVTMTERHIALTSDIGAGADHVRADGRRLEQALQNLVANAVRHTPDGGRVSVSSALVDGRVRLRVEDTGPGVPPDHLPLVFDRFYKIDQSRATPGGSGLGLSIVKAIVERHGGSVTAAAAEGGGARFDLLLPA
jgi:signal transduction histidine kinase